MKIYKLNSLTTFLFIFLIIGLVVFLPILLIETLWNSTIGKTYTDYSINFWQSLILWLIALVSFNILGLFKFEFAVETADSFDKEGFKKKLEGLQNTKETTKEIAENLIKPETIDQDKSKSV